MVTKYVIEKEVECVYYSDNGVLFFIPIYKDGTFNLEEACEVEEDLIGSEVINLKTGKTLYELYEEIKIKLQ